ncbi:MAG: PASTA domain-containing protein [Oscillospiraceae bacterium]|nr:PASTA domain-containing protein [Oscillospiraceae bacterium]
MKLLEFFYNSWFLICIISTAAGLLVNFTSINKSAEKRNTGENTETNRFMKLLKYLFNIVIVVLIVFSGITYSLFTRVPEVTGMSVSEARRYLRDCNLNDEILPNLKYNDMYVNSEINFQSIDEGEIMPKGTIIYLNYTQNVNMFENITDNDDNNYNDDSPENQITNPNVSSELTNQNDKKVIVPDVVGMEQNDAVSALYMAGLQFQVYWDAAESDNDKYYVVNQSYKYGDSVSLGTIIKLELSPILPESINYKIFTYEQDDSSVKSTSELNGFYIYSQSVTSASFYNAVTDEVFYPDYLPEKLCQVCFNMSGVDNAILSIYMDGKNTGVCIDNNEGKSEFFINKGNYAVNADFGNNTKTEYVYIDSSGEYKIDFK